MHKPFCRPILSSTQSFLLCLSSQCHPILFVPSWPSCPCTAKTLYRKLETNIPRKETARPRSQFLHSYIYERFIYSQDLYAYLAQQKRWTYECGNGERGRAVSFLGIHKSDLLCRVLLQCQILLAYAQYCCHCTSLFYSILFLFIPDFPVRFCFSCPIVFLVHARHFCPLVSCIHCPEAEFMNAQFCWGFWA